jgi:hypothetical protein
MNPAVQSAGFAQPRTELGLYNPSHDRNSARWRINGYPARIIIWTVDEWASLADRPDDAQYYPCGVWCALRVD